MTAVSANPWRQNNVALRAQPVPVPVAFPGENLPPQMLAAKRWLVWRSVQKPGAAKPRKVPHYPDGTPRRDTLDSPEDQARFGTYEDACLRFVKGGFAGLGFALGPDGTGNHWQGADLDNIADHAGLNVIAEDLPGYVELSPSGKGQHAIGYGRPFDALGSNSSGIEAYSSGRFFTVTGEGAGLAGLCCLADFVRDRLAPVHKAAGPQKSASANTTPASPTDPLPLTDEQIVDLRSALTALRADDHAEWIRIGQCLKTGGEVCRSLWIEWSQTSALFQPSDARKWDGFKGDNAGISGVFAAAQNAGWVNPRSKAAQVVPVIESESLIASTGIDLRAVNPTPVRHVVAQLIPRKVVTVGGADGGLGKTTLAALISALVAEQRAFGPLATERGRVLFVSLEDPAEKIWATIRKTCEHFGLDPDKVARAITVLDGSDAEDSALALEVSDAGVRRLVATGIYQQVAECAVGFDLIVVDNASDAYDANESERRLVRRFVRGMLGKIARDNDAGVLLLVHIDKSAARHGGKNSTYSGSTAWNNSARSRFAITKDDDGRLTLIHEKVNAGRLAEPIALRFTDTGLLVPTDAATAANDASASALILAQDARDVLQALSTAATAGTSITTAQAGAVTTWHALCRSGDLTGQLAKPSGKSRFWQALEHLRRAGQVAPETYCNQTRKTKERWTVSGELESAA